jgi:hypothetical protein
VKLLRWYPAVWRDRYGDEMLAMIEDTLGDQPPPLRLRAQLMRAGVHEHLRRAALIGTDRPADDRCRAGAALVLAGWGVMVVAGAIFAKTTEHWRWRRPQRSGPSRMPPSPLSRRLQLSARPR